MGIVIAQIAAACRGDPDLGGIAGGGTLRHMDVNGLQRVVFIGPEIDPVGANLKTCGIVEAPFLGELEDQVGRGADDFVIPGNVFLGKAKNVGPLIAGENAVGMVEAVLRIGLFQIDLYSMVRPHFGVDDLGAVIEGQKGIHHKITS